MNDTNKIIAEWLKLETTTMPHPDGTDHLYLTVHWQHIDFLHDRNQQKWIEEKLIEKKYNIDFQYERVRDLWHVIIHGSHCNWIARVSKSKDQAFIDAVMELINQEEKK